MEFREGDNVEITIKGTVKEAVAYGRHQVRDEWERNHFVYLTGAPVKVTRVISDWPPQPGDIWESEGKEYAALWANRAQGHNVTLHSITDVVRYEADEFREFPGLRLIRRRESS